MGEEKKERETSKEESNEKKEESKKDKKEEEVPQEVVLKVDMHCEACARKVKRALKGLEGVEEIMADYKASKVVVKGKQVAADPLKACQRIQKKCGRKVELISPIPKPLLGDEDNQENKQQEPPKEEIKKEPPPVVTIVLKVRMHCDACAQVLQKRISKLQGVESVSTDIASDSVIVKGILDPEKLVSDVYKKTGKKASIVANEEGKKEEEQKKKKNEEKAKEEEEKKESGEDKSSTKEGGEDGNKKSEMIKRSEYWPPSKYNYMEYYHAPQLFSDENPNACSVM